MRHPTTAKVAAAAASHDTKYKRFAYFVSLLLLLLSLIKLHCANCRQHITTPQSLPALSQLVPLHVRKGNNKGPLSTHAHARTPCHYSYPNAVARGRACSSSDSHPSSARMTYWLIPLRQTCWPVSVGCRGAACQNECVLY